MNELVLMKNVELWHEEEVECVKEAFERAGPLVTKRLVCSLFRYWCAREPAALLFAVEAAKCGSLPARASVRRTGEAAV